MGCWGRDGTCSWHTHDWLQGTAGWVCWKLATHVTAPLLPPSEGEPPLLQEGKPRARSPGRPVMCTMPLMAIRSGSVTPASPTRVWPARDSGRASQTGRDKRQGRVSDGCSRLLYGRHSWPAHGPGQPSFLSRASPEGRSRQQCSLLPACWRARRAKCWAPSQAWLPPRSAAPARP